MPTVWIARVLISERIAAKIAANHGLEGWEVREAVECVPGLQGAWNMHAHRGRRLLVKATIREHLVLIVLYPAADPFGETFRLGSAYPVKNT